MARMTVMMAYFWRTCVPSSKIDSLFIATGGYNLILKSLLLSVETEAMKKIQSVSENVIHIQERTKSRKKKRLPCYECFPN